MNTLLAIALVALGIALAIPAQSQQPGPTQDSVAGGVTVKVTPRRTDGPEWEFAVVLDTHSQDLADDVQRTAVLVVDGKEYRPVQWQGAAPGGHHREGVLRFADIPPRVGAFELRLTRAGEAAPRIFRWAASPP